MMTPKHRGGSVGAGIRIAVTVSGEHWFAAPVFDGMTDVEAWEEAEWALPSGAERRRFIVSANDQLTAIEGTGPDFCACYDCGRRYGNRYGFPDLVVSNEVWAMISPTGHEGGLLCPSCLCRRAAAAGIEDATATFRSGPFCVHEPSPIATLREQVAAHKRNWDELSAMLDEANAQCSEVGLHAEAVEYENNDLRELVKELREGLEFYADPYKHTDAVPDFYSELDFGERAQSLIAKADKATGDE